jgi:hypothetical protein
MGSNMEVSLGCKEEVSGKYLDELSWKYLVEACRILGERVPMKYLWSILEVF